MNTETVNALRAEIINAVENLNAQDARPKYSELAVITYTHANFFRRQDVLGIRIAPVEDFGAGGQSIKAPDVAVQVAAALAFELAWIAAQDAKDAAEVANGVEVCSGLRFSFDYSTDDGAILYFPQIPATSEGEPVTIDPNAIVEDRWVAIGSAIVNLHGIKDLESLHAAAKFAEVSPVMLARRLVGYNIETLHEVLCQFCREELGTTELADGRRVCGAEQCIDEATAPAATTEHEHDYDILVDPQPDYGDDWEEQWACKCGAKRWMS